MTSERTESSITRTSQRTFTGTIRVFLAESLAVPTGLLTAAFLTRQLGSGNYGLYILAVAIVFWVESIVASIFARPTVKFVGEAEDWRPIGTAIVQWQFIVSLCALGALWLLSDWLSTSLLNEPSLTIYLRLLALDIPIDALAQSHRNILVGFGAFSQRAIGGAVNWIVRLLLIVTFIELGLSIKGAILGTIGASLAEFLLYRFFVRPAVWVWSGIHLRRLIDYGVPAFLLSLVLSTYDKIGLLALRILGGTIDQAGFYGAAQNLTIIPAIFSLSFSPLLLSSLSRALRDGNTVHSQTLARDGIRLVLLLLPFAGMTAGASEEVVEWIYGVAFQPTAPILALLIFGALGLLMISVTSAIMIAAGKPNLLLLIVVPLLPISILGYVSFVPLWKTIGAATATSFSTTIAAVAAMAGVYHIWRVVPPLSTLWKTVLLTVLAYAMAALVPTSGLGLLFKLSAITVGIALAFFALGEFDAGEMALVRTLIPWQNVPERDVPVA